MTMPPRDPLKASVDCCEAVATAERSAPLCMLAAGGQSGMADQRWPRLFMRAVESSPNGFMMTDAVASQHPIIYVNPAFERITGYPAVEAVGRSAHFLLGAQLDQPALHIIRQALRSRASGQAVVQCFHKSGASFWNRLTVEPVLDDEGQVSHYVSILDDVSEQMSTEYQLAHLATHDALTGLVNRTLLIDRLAQAITHSAHDGHITAVLLINLDRFKQVNNSLGHSLGDIVLRAVATRLEASVHEGNTVARLGGDEFVVVLTELVRNEGATQVAGELLSALGRPFEIDGRELFITPSIGISFYPQDGEDAVSLLRLADLAMYQAKASGRNGFSCYAQHMNLRAQEMAGLESDLRRALDNSELQLYYQPKADLYSGEICGAEALIRWLHPVKGLILPGQFIPLAEESGIILSIGEWVLREACRQMKQWQREGLPPLTVAVNLSALQCLQESIVDIVAQALKDADLDPGCLQLELTESMVMQNLEAAASLLHRFKALGVSLAMDDFGTGYSSLGYLRQFPFDCLKIDRSFVQNITTEPDDALIAVAVIAMAHSLRLYVVAEGVETESQMRYLRKQNCDQLQGFFFSRPLPADDFFAFVRRADRLPLDHEAPDASLRTLLLVDDEEHVINSIRRMLRRSGYRILTATSAAAALELLALNDVQVVLSDQRMPHMSGAEFLGRVKALYPGTVRMLLSGYSDFASLTDAINHGAIFRFLTKPWDEDDLRQQIHNAFIHQERELTVRAPLAVSSARAGHANPQIRYARQENQGEA